MLPPASGVLTDPGPLCTGQTATLTCNITGGTRINWNYIVGGTRGLIPTYDPDIGVSPPTEPVTANGVEFTASVLMTQPQLVSTISFVPSTMMNGGELVCSGFAGVLVSEAITLHVDSTSKLEEGKGIAFNYIA